MSDSPDQVVDGPAELAFVDRVLDAVQSLGTELQSGFEQDRTLFMLAVSEITTNIVMHNEGEASVRVELDASPQELRAVIRDTAPPAAVDVETCACPAQTPNRVAGWRWRTRSWTGCATNPARRATPGRCGGRCTPTDPPGQSARRPQNPPPTAPDDAPADQRRGAIAVAVA